MKLSKIALPNNPPVTIIEFGLYGYGAGEDAAADRFVFVIGIEVHERPLALV